VQEREIADRKALAWARVRGWLDDPSPSPLPHDTGPLFYPDMHLHPGDLLPAEDPLEGLTLEGRGGEGLGSGVPGVSLEAWLAEEAGGEFLHTASEARGGGGKGRGDRREGTKDLSEALKMTGTAEWGLHIEGLDGQG
jgi:hypothetical protein